MTAAVLAFFLHSALAAALSCTCSLSLTSACIGLAFLTSSTVVGADASCNAKAVFNTCIQKNMQVT